MGTASQTGVKFLRFQDLGNLEWLHASYEKQSFSPHFHKGHVIGVIEKGHLGFDYRGEKVVASAGQINIADPGEVHNGFCPSSVGWQYRMFYLGEGQLGKICNELCDRQMAMPVFKKGVIKDHFMAQEIYALHSDFENPKISLLEKESRFHLLMAQMILRHAPKNICRMPTGREHEAVDMIKAYIHDHYGINISLADLSSVTGKSRYHLLRLFSKHTGLTPHAYLNLTRASKAKQLLDEKVSIIDAANAVGFFDQSHLNRIFKRIYGITPGQYNNAQMPAA